VHAFPTSSSLTGEDQTLDSSYLRFGRTASVRFEDVVRQSSALPQKQTHVKPANPHPCGNAVLNEVGRPKLQSRHGRRHLKSCD